MPYFRAFSAFSVTATNFMNSITFVMNHLISYFDISICHCSNRTLCYHLFKFHGFNYGYFLGGPRYIHLTKETNAAFPGLFDPLAPAAIIYRWPFSYGKTWLPSEAMFNLTIFLQNAQVPGARLFRGIVFLSLVLPTDPAH